MEVEIKPTLHLSSEELKEIKDWEVGETYMINLTVKKTHKNEHETDDGVEYNATFEILNAKGKSLDGFDGDPYGRE